MFLCVSRMNMNESWCYDCYFAHLPAVGQNTCWLQRICGTQIPCTIHKITQVCFPECMHVKSCECASVCTSLVNQVGRSAACVKPRSTSPLTDELVRVPAFFHWNVLVEFR